MAAVSPFPGMDPFLEQPRYWQMFHGWFIRKLVELHLPLAQELNCILDVERYPEQLEVFRQDYLVIREGQELNRVLSVVELLSPANKSGNYAEVYQQKRQRLLGSMVHFLEIDLLRDGENPSRRLFPELPTTPYFAFLARKTGLGRNEEGYPLRLQDPLPKIGLPVRSGKPDLLLDLAATFREAYSLTIQNRRVAYRPDVVPPPSLAQDEKAWVARILQS